MIRLAINGYGRIGRCVLRALYESDHRSAMTVVAINEPADLNTIQHLTRYDSTHGRFPGKVTSRPGYLIVNDDDIAVTHHEALDAIDWRDQQVDVVLECSGEYTSRASAEMHRQAGASKVLFSQPADADIKTIVYGINHSLLNENDAIASSASCTTNAIVPVISVLHEVFGIESGMMTTIHSAMNDQPVLDAYHHTDLRKTRAASQSIIPVDTGLAKGIDRVLPELSGRFSAHALRVPTVNVSAIDLTVSLAKDTTVKDINKALEEAGQTQLPGILCYTTEPLASCDYIHEPCSAVVDGSQTRLSGGNLAHVLTWFDNEWAYANRMLDVVAHWLNAKAEN